MKFGLLTLGLGLLVSHPTRGAWIEMRDHEAAPHRQPSHPTRGAWIEMLLGFHLTEQSTLSHPTRGAWIEMLVLMWRISPVTVAPHTGCVD